MVAFNLEWGAAGQHLVEGVREALQVLLQSVRRHQVLHDVDQTCNVALCSETLPGRRRQGGGSWAGWRAARRAPAQRIGAGLLGQLPPACIRRLALDTPRDEPPPRLAPDNSKRAPRQV